jgi:hypothetical protein
MFITQRHDQEINYYRRLLGKIGCFSKLFSESDSPLLPYRATEKLFCRAFHAEDLGRADIVVDAKLGAMGIAIKTFLEKNGSSNEKIAEFNEARGSYDKLPPLEKIKKICELRNERICFAKRLHGLDSVVYHCIVRGRGKIMIFEQPLVEISVKDIRLKRVSKAAISFGDGQGEYSFNLSKNTLLKKFHSRHPLLTIPLKIIGDPFDFLDEVVGEEVWQRGGGEGREETAGLQQIFLPLYSRSGEDKVVFPRSGLNQWNAGGRKRADDEVYVPIPSLIRNKYPDFFPKKDAEFTILLPGSKSLCAKVCQQGRKALMSNPNGALGKWMLRDVMQIKPRKLLSYSTLLATGFDSIRLTKINPATYEMQFSKVGSYEDFVESQVQGEGKADRGSNGIIQSNERVTRES